MSELSFRVLSPGSQCRLEYEAHIHWKRSNWLYPFTLFHRHRSKCSFWHARDWFTTHGRVQQGDVVAILRFNRRIHHARIAATCASPGAGHTLAAKGIWSGDANTGWALLHLEWATHVLLARWFWWFWDFLDWVEFGHALLDGGGGGLALLVDRVKLCLGSWATAADWLAQATWDGAQLLGQWFFGFERDSDQIGFGIATFQAACGWLVRDAS